MANFKGFKQVLKADFNETAEKVGYLWFVRESAESTDGEIYFGSRLYGKVSADVDLTNYYNKEEVDGLLANKLEADALEGYAKDADLAVIVAMAKEIALLIGIDPETEPLELVLGEAFEGASTVVEALQLLASRISEHEAAAEAKYAEIEGKIDGLKITTEVKEDGKTYVQLLDAEGAVISEFDAAQFVKDGMLDNVELDGNNLILTFNTDAGKEQISVDLSTLIQSYVFNEAQFVVDGANVSLNAEYIKGLISAAESGITIVEGNGVSVIYGTSDDGSAVVTVSAKVAGDVEGNFLAVGENGLYAILEITGDDQE